MKTHKQAIAYYRVSTARQGHSGLGLEAQQEAVTQYASNHGYELVKSYTEIESGRKKQRPQLQAAQDACKKQKATLIIAKLDRLARNVHFISTLIEAKVDFVAVDNPQANKLMLHMLAAFAEHESDIIRTRIREALAAAKRRGVHLGRHGKTLAKQNQQKALTFSISLRPRLEALQSEGITSLRAQAAALNQAQIPSFDGGKWHKTSVNRVRKRLSA